MDVKGRRTALERHWSRATRQPGTLAYGPDLHHQDFERAHPGVRRHGPKLDPSHRPWHLCAKRPNAQSQGQPAASARAEKSCSGW